MNYFHHLCCVIGIYFIQRTAYLTSSLKSYRIILCIIRHLKLNFKERNTNTECCEPEITYLHKIQIKIILISSPLEEETTVIKMKQRGNLAFIKVFKEI